MSSFSEKPVSKKRLVLFKTVSILSPLIVLLVLEYGLRLFGYGHNLDLFTEDLKHPGYLVMNEHTSKKYFAQQQNATFGNYEPFRKHKAPGTFRIFILGESTAIGYPYMHNGSFHRWLQYRLVHTFPDQTFEIINLSLTAVNSYTVLDFARQITEHQPDAVLVYTGHNEYYGAMGVGSTSFAGWHPALIRLLIKIRALRVIQLITTTLVKVTNSDGAKIDLRENLMKRMVASQQIPFGSDQYRRGIRQFETNMQDLCSVLIKNHIPLYISTLVSNEKDLKPLTSAAGEDKRSATMQYELGQKAYQKNKFTEALTHFTEAKELDLLRFRAPEAMNMVIRALPARFPAVRVVDTERIFRQNSAHGILGHETLLEHVHPNLLGYALLSDAFYQALKSDQRIDPNEHNEISFEKLRQQMPITRVDSLKAVYEIMMLKEGWPFNEPMPSEDKHERSMEEQLAGGLAVKQISWETALGELLKYYLKENNLKGALQVNEALALEFPLEPAYPLQGGLLNLRMNQNTNALFYLKQAFKLKNTPKTAQHLFITLLKEDRPEEAMMYLSYAAANHQSSFSVSDLQDHVKQIITLKNKLSTDSNNTEYSNRIAFHYLQFANTRAAEKYLNYTLLKNPANTAALQMKQSLRAMTVK